MARIHLVLALLSVFLALAAASSSAPSFCKCTCFTNSTIIPLNPPHEQTPSDGSAGSSRLARRWTEGDARDDNLTTLATDMLSAPLVARAGTASCSRCNRAYCLSSGLPICRGAEEKDVVAACFQRDSRKDQIIVWCFLVGTAGLLGWAAAKRVIEARGGGGTTITTAAGTGAATGPETGTGQQSLLGSTSGGRGRGSAAASSSFFQRVRALFSRSPSSATRPEPQDRQWNPFSPTTAEPRGEYARLGSSGTD